MNISNQKAARWRKRFLKKAFLAWRRMLRGRGERPRLRRPKSRRWFGKRLRRNRTTPRTGARAPWRRASGISEKSVRRIWHPHGLKPHLTRTFKISNDPQFAEKLEAIIGLYLNPPEHAIVLCADEKSQIQALDRTQPGLPLKKGAAAP